MKSGLEEFLSEVVREYAKQKGVTVPADLEDGVSVSKDPTHGDYASNVAFKLTKLVREKPEQIAGELVQMIQAGNSKAGKPAMVERVEIAGGGFINFFLNKNSLGQVLRDVLQQGDRFGASQHGRSKKVLLEFVSANPTGPLTIAHGRQAAIGDCLARILHKTGHEVTSEYYLNDAGRQMNLLGASLFARYSEKLGRTRDLPEDGYRGEYLKDLAGTLVSVKQDSLLKEPEERAIAFCREFAGRQMMKTIETDLQSIQVSFDVYFSESQLYQKGMVEESLRVLSERGHLYEQEGASWFRSTTFGDDKDRVVKKSSGEYTYLAPDIAYHHHKFQRGYNWLVNLWGPDHHGYIPRIKAACQALGHDPQQVEILIVQLTSLFRQGQPVRMSTRAGEFVTLNELVTEVGADAARFFFIMRKIESHLDFDLDLAKQKSQDNPVYYLQYAHARIASLLKFANRAITPQANVELLRAPEEGDLIKWIAEYPQVLIRASDLLEPYRLTDYLRELAAMFHKFYSCHRVVTEDEELTKARLLLVEATRIVLKNGLLLLGIAQPESM